MTVKFYDKLPENQDIVLDLPLYSGRLGSAGKVLDRSKYHNNGTLTGTTLSAGLGRIFKKPMIFTKEQFLDFITTAYVVKEVDLEIALRRRND